MSSARTRLDINVFRMMALAAQGASFVPFTIRRAILKLCGLRIGSGSTIEAGGRFASRRVKIGAETYANIDLLIDGEGEVVIGSNVRIGPGVKIITSTHTITDNPRARASIEPVFRPVFIGDGVWLGANVVVLPGVAVAEGCVVAAAAVVARDTEPNGLYAGVPARRIRDLTSDPAQT